VVSSECAKGTWFSIWCGQMQTAVVE
jgi:hypothetical protein